MDTGPTSHVETEQKYDADPGFTMPDFGALPGYSVTGPERYDLSATYFDTTDLRLAANRVTLRRRTGGTDAAWHLKLPVRPGTRRELHLPLSEGTDTVPSQMQAMVTDITGGGALHPIARLDTTRTVRRLTGTDGQVLAEVADDEVTARRLRPEGDPMRWHEIEVELVSGPTAVLEVAGKLLREAGARVSASASKLGRLLAAD
jgi:inorganic triphosphatase YgiF